MSSFKSDSPAIHTSLKVYTLLLALYPRPFQQEYALQMRQTFADYLRQVSRESGWLGLGWWWLVTLFDFVHSVTEEHLQRSFAMSKEKYIRLGSWSLMLAPALLIVDFVLTSLGERNFSLATAYEKVKGFILLPFPLLFALGLVAIFLQYQKKLGTLGKFSLISGAVFTTLAFLGLIVYLVFKQEDFGWTSFVGGLIFFALALTVWGVEVLRRRYLPRWQNLPFLSGGFLVVMVFVQPILAPEGETTPISELLVNLAILSLCIGTFLLGYLLQKQTALAEKKS